MVNILRLAYVLVVALVALAALPAPSLAQQAEGGAAVERPVITLDRADALFDQWEKSALAVEERLQSEPITPAVLTDFRQILDPQRVNSRTLATQARDQLAPLVAQLDSLGPPPEEGASEAPAVTVEREEINKRIAGLRAVVSKSDLAFTRADRLIATATDAQRQRFTDELLQRGPAPFDPRHWLTAGTTVLAVSGDVVAEATATEARQRRREVWRDAGPTALAALAFALLMLVFARRYALQRLSRAIQSHPPQEIDAETEMSAYGGMNARERLDDAPVMEGRSPAPVLGLPPSRTRRLLVGIGVTLTRLLMPMAAILAARYALSILDLLGPTGKVLVNGLSIGLAFVALSYALVFAFFAPRTPELRFSNLTNATAGWASFYGMTIAVALALNIGLVGAGEKLDLPEASLAVFNLGTVVIAAWGLWRMAGVWSEKQAVARTVAEGEDAPAEEENWFAENLILSGRRAAHILAIVTPLAAVSGYYALSRYILQSGILSAAVIGTAVILFMIANEASQALYEVADEKKDKGKGAAPGRKEERVSLFPVFIGFVLALVALPVLALVWGATTGDLEEAYFGLTEGFTIGETRFRPGDLLIAALVFGLGLFVTRLFQAVVRRVVMPRTRLDVGARSSIVSGLGYLGFFIAALMAISIGGIDLTNLAFLGAALGVGIGFGLQNIVNNFVSGIILLIERPIKVGDWIEVANTHGTVQKINVRSTEIKTFDKASYIVPNSELISGAVTNYTHEDVMGRVICPVGVAYGTDVRKVERILLEIARAHPMTLRRPAPQVIFQSFGGSSLDFELRAFLRDVMWVVATRSDINFEIERRFEEEGIEVPFGQTDVTVKNAAEMIQLISKTAAFAQPRPERFVEERSSDKDDPVDPDLQGDTA